MIDQQSGSQARQSMPSPLRQGFQPAEDHAGQMRPRVLMVIDRLVGGGAERVAVELAAAAARRGHPTTLIAKNEPDAREVAQRLMDAGVCVHTIGGEGFRSLLELLRLAGWRQFDILHTHVHRSNCRGALLSKLSGIRIFIATEHSWRYRGRLRRRLRDRYLVAPLADAFVTVSEADRRALLDFERIPSARLHVIPNGVPLELERRTASPETVARLRAIRRRARPLIGTVCYLRRQKAMHDLIWATSLLRRSVPTAELAIIGDGPLAADLHDLVASGKAEHYVHFLGHSNEPRALLPYLDVFAMSSEFEGMPLALLDAMAERRTIVATSVGAIPELTPHRQAALLVKPGAPTELAAALEEVAMDDDLAKRLARNAATLVRAYSSEVSVARWFELYDSLWQRTQDY